MSITADEKAKIIKEFGKNEKDTGSTEVCVRIVAVRMRHFRAVWTGQYPGRVVLCGWKRTYDSVHMPARIWGSIHLM